MLNESLKSVSVLGAAGKMGRGISLLLLQEMARIEAETCAAVGTGEFQLHLFDTHYEGLTALKKQLRSHLQRYAEKNINRLREYFASRQDLISNEQVITTFVEGGIDNIHLDLDISNSKNSTLIFEAVIEDMQIKIDLYSHLKEITQGDIYYFSNTSSIPIHYLSQQSGAANKIIGYHFYNPPDIQKLIELIIPSNCSQKLEQLASELTQRLGKIAVRSNDIAGFIGNGHFMREIAYACQKVDELSKHYSLNVAIAMIDKVTRDFLLRPMGIFQLIDYVGIDVCKKIMSVMEKFLNIPLCPQLIDTMISKGKKGGQYPDGSQKEGFFSYENKNPSKIFDSTQHTYVPISNTNSLGPFPLGDLSWKKLHGISDKDEILKNYFSSLFSSTTLGAKIAQDYLCHSRDIARKLVQEGVANSMEDINTILINGFFHSYGIENPWIPEKTCQK